MTNSRSAETEPESNASRISRGNESYTATGSSPPGPRRSSRGISSRDVGPSASASASASGFSARSRSLTSARSQSFSKYSSNDFSYAVIASALESNRLKNGSAASRSLFFPASANSPMDLHAKATLAHVLAARVFFSISRYNDFKSKYPVACSHNRCKRPVENQLPSSPYDMLAFLSAISSKSSPYSRVNVS